MGEKLLFKRPVVVSKLRRTRPLCAEEFTYLRGADQPSGENDHHQRSAGRGLLRQGKVSRCLSEN